MFALQRSLGFPSKRSFENKTYYASNFKDWCHVGKIIFSAYRSPNWWKHIRWQETKTGKDSFIENINKNIVKKFDSKHAGLLERNRTTTKHA